jgi:hypothetical protein
MFVEAISNGNEHQSDSEDVSIVNVEVKRLRGLAKLHIPHMTFESIEALNIEFSKENNERNYRKKTKSPNNNVLYYKCKGKGCQVAWKVYIPTYHVPNVFDYKSTVTHEMYYHNHEIIVKKQGLSHVQKDFVLTLIVTIKD